MLRQLDAAYIRVRTTDELSKVDRLILPGGESTTMLRFIDQNQMASAISDFAESRPVWGICAGAILAARKVVHPEQPSLNLIDVQAHRNFYGSQLDSFTTNLAVHLLKGKTVEAHFIRAPMLSALPPTLGRNPVTEEASVDGQPVFFTQGQIWACSFHVELGRDVGLHEKFLQL